MVSSMDEFAKNLVKRGHKLLIVCPSYPELDVMALEEPVPTLRIPSLPAVVSKEDRLAKLWYEPEVFRELDAFKPDVVHIQTEFSIGQMGRRYCHHRGFPIISTCHTHWEMYISNYLHFLPPFLGKTIARILMRQVYNRDTVVIVPSRQIEAVLRRYGVQREIVCIPNGVDNSLFYPRLQEASEFRAKIAQRFPALSSGPILLFAGRLGYEKNVLLLMDAFIKVLQEISEANLIFIGDGPVREELRHKAQNAGIQNHVHFTGYVPRTELPLYYSIATIFTFPSVTETQGLVTIESMLCGTPVVGVNEMGTAEVMEGERGGLLAENNAESVAEKILLLLKNPSLLEQKRQEALAQGQRWTIENSCTLLENVYRRFTPSQS
ncbi:glycosyltransferase [Gracilinema caldarium]|uniref:glycosyltransferase n=1 Tax=Gracilinema caldarium TaxID=215591 RepID=UPI0026EF03C1|nr:glycosyltransferase [Gracilinema caldarium]